MSVQPLFYYRMMPGASMRLGAVIVNGRTLTGPMPLPLRASEPEDEPDPFAEGLDDSEAAFTRHRELDPHCTCPDCMEYHERNTSDEDDR